MTIEIHRPELEALIMDRMRSGAFQTVEDAILQALRTAPAVSTPEILRDRTGAELVAALQASPFRDIEIEPARHRLPVRDAAI